MRIHPAFVIAAIVVSFIGSCVGISYVTETKACEETWHNSGMRSRYGFWTDCLVETSPGIWLPEKSLRDFPLQGTPRSQAK